MSLTSLDGLLPSTFKKLLAGEMPELKSAHLSEAMAAGCGYRNNAAYLTDLKSAVPVTFVAVDRIDSKAMSKRLAEVTGGNPADVTKRVAETLARIHAHVRGDIVPVGPLSGIKVDLDAVPRYATGRELHALFARKGRDGEPGSMAAGLPYSRKTPISHSAIGNIMEPIMGRIRFDKDADISRERARNLLERLLPAFKWIVLPNTPHVGHLSLSLSPTILSAISLGKFEIVPAYERNEVIAYLADFQLRTPSGYDTIRSRHKVISDAIRRALYAMIEDRELPRGWTDYGSGAALFTSHFVLPENDKSGTSQLDELRLTLQGLIETEYQEASRTTKDRAFVLAKLACDSVGNSLKAFTAVDLEHAATLAYIMRKSSATATHFGYLSALPYVHKEPPLPKAVAKHSEAERLFRAALARPEARKLIPVD